MHGMGRVAQLERNSFLQVNNLRAASLLWNDSMPLEPDQLALRSRKL